MREMDAYTFAEWRAYDAIEPIDAAGAMLRALSESGDGISESAISSRPNWMNQKLQMLHYFKLFGKKKG